jgi:hypothetical protein
MVSDDLGIEVGETGTGWNVASTGLVLKDDLHGR